MIMPCIVIGCNFILFERGSVLVPLYFLMVSSRCGVAKKGLNDTLNVDVLLSILVHEPPTGASPRQHLYLYAVAAGNSSIFFD